MEGGSDGKQNQKQKEGSGPKKQKQKLTVTGFLRCSEKPSLHNHPVHRKQKKKQQTRPLPRSRRASCKPSCHCGPTFSAQAVSGGNAANQARSSLGEAGSGKIAPGSKRIGRSESGMGLLEGHGRHAAGRAFLGVVVAGDELAVVSGRIEVSDTLRQRL